MAYLTSMLSACLSLAMGVGAPRAVAELPAAPWNEANAEHLLNRAGFGATPSAVREAVEMGREASVERLLRGPDQPVMPFYAERLGPRDMTRSERREMRSMMADEGERRDARRERNRRDGAQLRAFRGWWVDRMLASEDPLRERMTLFWHGYFTSSNRDVKSSYEMIRQNQLLRRHALGNFGSLLAAIAKDPAMLEYLDNDENRKKEPNENFARELMELFTLGEGNYDENDVKEAARAFTGYTDRDGEFVFRKKGHDRGRKTVLGVEGRLNGDRVIKILLKQEACAQWVSGRLIEYFEGVPAEPARAERYAERLRQSGYDLTDFLRALFLDDGFYRDEVVGTRIASPVDFLTGAVRRLGASVPSALVVGGAASLGEELLNPPNVKGWEGGRAWITNGSLLQRGNLAAGLLGLVEVRDVLGTADRRAMGMASLSWRPSLNLSWLLRREGLETDAEIVGYLGDALLAVPMTDVGAAHIALALEEERQELKVADGEVLSRDVDAERALRRVAHLVLSLPEAQLH